MPDCTSSDSSHTNKSSHCRKKMKWAFFLGLEVAIETRECRIASKKEDIFNHPAHKSKQKTVTWHSTSVVIGLDKVNEHSDGEGNNWDPLRKLFIFQVYIYLIVRCAKPFSNAFTEMHISQSYYSCYPGSQFLPLSQTDGSNALEQRQQQ